MHSTEKFDGKVLNVVVSTCIQNSIQTGKVAKSVNIRNSLSRIGTHHIKVNCHASAGYKGPLCYIASCLTEVDSSDQFK